MDLYSQPAFLDGEVRPLKKWWNVPGWIIAGFPTTEKYYRYYTFQQTVSDGLGSPPFKRKPIGLALTYLLVIPALLWAFHRRHWVVRKLRDWRLRRAIGSAAKAPRLIRADLDRLDTPELELLLACLQTDADQTVKLYGHKVWANGQWHLLPDSTFAKLVRIPEIMAALKTPPQREACIQEIAARLAYLHSTCQL